MNYFLLGTLLLDSKLFFDKSVECDLLIQSEIERVKTTDDWRRMITLKLGFNQIKIVFFGQERTY